MNERREVKALINVIKKLIEQEKEKERKSGYVISVDNSNNTVTVVLSDGSYNILPMPSTGPVLPGDSIIVNPDGSSSIPPETIPEIGGNELLRNGNFSLGNLKYWKYANIGDVELNTDAKIGPYSIKGLPYQFWDAEIYQDINYISVISGELYRHGCWVKILNEDDESATMAVWLSGEWYDRNGNKLVTEYNESEKKVISPKDGWVNLSLINRAPQNATFVRVKFMMQSHTPNTYVFWSGLSFWGKSLEIPGSTIIELPPESLDSIPPLNPLNLIVSSGVSVQLNGFNFYIDAQFNHIDTTAYDEDNYLWENTDFDHYDIFYKVSGQDYKYYGAFVLDSYKPSGTTLTYRLNNLNKNTTYRVMVKAVDEVGNASSGVESAYITTPYNQQPPAPTINTSKSNFNSENAEVFWSKVQSYVGTLLVDAKDYKVEVYNSSDQLKRTEYVNSTSYVYTLEKNIADNTTPINIVKIKVYARDAEGLESPASTVTLTNYAPATVTDLALNFKSEDLLATWTAVTKDTQNNTVYDIAGYKVEVYVGGNKKREAIVKDTSYTYTLNDNIKDNTTPASQVTIRVRAIDTLNQLGGYQELVATNYPPAQVTGLTADFKSENVVANWNAVTTDNQGNTCYDLDGYKVEIWIGGNKKREFLTKGTSYTYSLSDNIKDNGSAASTITLKVTALDKLNQTGNYTETTITNYPPANVTNLNYDFSTKDAFIWWDVVTKDSQQNICYDIVGYEVIVTPSGSSSGSYLVSNNRFSYLYENNTTKVPQVNFKVYAVDALGQKSASPAEVTARNKYPFEGQNSPFDKPPKPIVIPAFKKVFVKWDSPEEIYRARNDITMKDVTDVEVWYSTSGDFSNPELLATITNNFFVHEGLETDKEYYYRLRFKDIFNQYSPSGYISDSAYVSSDYITTDELAGEIFQLKVSASYAETNVNGLGINDIKRLYDGKYDLPAYFGSGASTEQFIEIEFPVTHVVNKSSVYIYSGGTNYYMYWAYKKDEDEDWVYLAGGEFLNEYPSVQEAYANMLPVSGSQLITFKWPYQREVKKLRFYFPSGSYAWSSGNYISELKASTFFVADEIDAGIINLAKGIQLYNDKTGGGFKLTSDGAIFEKGYITVFGDGGTVIEDGKIYVRSSGTARSLNSFFSEEEGETVIDGGYIKTGTIDLSLLKVAGKGYFINRVKNPSFEVPDALFENQYPECWSVSGGSVGTFVYGDNPSFAKYGRRYIELVASGTSPYNGEIWSDYIDIISNGEIPYTFSFYYAGTSGSKIDVYLNEYSSGSNPIRTDTVCSSFGILTNSYNRHIYTFIPKEETKSIRIRFRQTNTTQPSGATVRFDAFQLEEGNQATDFKATYDVGTVFVDPTGIVVNHSGGSRTIINAEGITIERGTIYIMTDNNNIDLLDQVTLSDNLLTNGSFELFDYSVSGDKSTLINPHLWGWSVMGSIDRYWIEKHSSPQFNLWGGNYLTFRMNGSSGSSVVMVSNKVLVDSNSLYSMSFYRDYIDSSNNIVFNVYVKGSSHSLFPSLSEFQNDVILKQLTVTPTSSKMWKRDVLENISVENATYIYVGFVLTRANDISNNYTISLDNVVLERNQKASLYKSSYADFVATLNTNNKLLISYMFPLGFKLYGNNPVIQ